jgi:hypothetical protein
VARRPSKPAPSRKPRPAAPKPPASVYTGLDDDEDDDDPGECDEHPEFLSRKPQGEKRGEE